MLSTKIWGNPTWYIMHKIAFNLPQNYNQLSLDKQKQLQSFYKILRWLLPCEKCKVNYGKHLNKYKIEDSVTSGKKLARWTVMTHNKVNEHLKKPIVSYQKALNIYHNKIDHVKLQNFIKQMLLLNTSAPLSNRKSVTRYTVMFYPCNSCRKRLSAYLEQNNLDKVDSSNKMTRWLKYLYKISKKSCVS